MNARSGSIWLHAFGYFACYAPYAALTKVASRGLLPGGVAVEGVALLPLSALASAVGMAAFITWRGWWKHADQRTAFGRSWPVPDGPTALSGVATAAVIATTTLSYTLSASILLMMVLMRGGVLVLAPIVDVVGRRPVRPRSWVALALCLTSLAVGIGGAAPGRLDAVALAVVAAYLAAYFVRLRAMSSQAKVADSTSSSRFFVQEQMVATPALLVVLAVAAAFPTPWAGDLRHGFTQLGSAVPWVLAIGLLSQGTGIFGALVLLDARENAFCVPVNRASSVLAGLLATGGLALGLGVRGPSRGELVGAGLLVVALVALGWPTRPKPAAKEAALGGTGRVS